MIPAVERHPTEKSKVVPGLDEDVMNG
jgi:hypothetical protein